MNQGEMEYILVEGKKEMTTIKKQSQRENHHTQNTTIIEANADGVDTHHSRTTGAMAGETIWDITVAGSHHHTIVGYSSYRNDSRRQ